MLDTKNFTLRTGERTFDAAAFLRRTGADTSEVKKLLQNDMEHTVEKYKILQSAQLYRNIAVATPETPQDRVVAAQAADELLNVSGVDASVVAYPSQGGVFISARSIGDVNVQMIMEKLGGGGNRNAAATQLEGLAMDFMAVSSYGGGTVSTGAVKINKDLSQDIAGKHIIFVEDILDSGVTLSYLTKYLMTRQPASISIATLMMIGEIPFVLRKRVYAVASLAGGCVYYGMYLAKIGSVVSAVTGIAVVFTIRMLATAFRWSLPKIH